MKSSSLSENEWTFRHPPLPLASSSSIFFLPQKNNFLLFNFFFLSLWTHSLTHIFNWHTLMITNWQSVPFNRQFTLTWTSSSLPTGLIKEIDFSLYHQVRRADTTREMQSFAGAKVTSPASPWNFSNFIATIEIKCNRIRISLLLVSAFVCLRGCQCKYILMLPVALSHSIFHLLLHPLFHFHLTIASCVLFTVTNFHLICANSLASCSLVRKKKLHFATPYEALVICSDYLQWDSLLSPLQQEAKYSSTNEFIQV